MIWHISLNIWSQKKNHLLVTADSLCVGVPGCLARHDSALIFISCLDPKGQPQVNTYEFVFLYLTWVCVWCSTFPDIHRNFSKLTSPRMCLPNRSSQAFPSASLLTTVGSLSLSKFAFTCFDKHHWRGCFSCRKKVLRKAKERQTSEPTPQVATGQTHQFSRRRSILVTVAPANHIRNLDHAITATAAAKLVDMNGTQAG